jgi:cellulose biosynthesis protein BcsQ
MAPLFSTLKTLERTVGVSWERILVIPTMVENRTVASAVALAHLREHYRAYLSRTYIRRSIAVVYAQAEAKAVQWFDPHSPSAEDYEALAKELNALPARTRQEVTTP